MASSSKVPSTEARNSPKLSARNLLLFNAATKYRIRLARVEAAWEFVAKGILKQIRHDALRAADTFTSGTPQQRAVAIASAAQDAADRFWPQVQSALISLSSRSAGLSTTLLNDAMKPSGESVEDSIAKANKTAEDEFGNRIDELQQLGIILFLLSQIQIQAYFQSIQIQGLSIESVFRDIGVTVYRRVYTTSASAIANGEDPRSAIEFMTREKSAIGRSGSLLPSIQAPLSTIVHGVGTGTMQLVTSANRQLFVGEIHSAIIDDVTCRVCRDLNGSYYPLDANGSSTARPVPVHRSCRCNLVPLVSFGESYGGDMPVRFDAWLRDNIDMQHELLGNKVKDFQSGRMHIGSFSEYRRNVQIPAQSYPELDSLIWQLSQ